VLLFGAYALVDGVFALVSAARHVGPEDRWWSLVFQGVIGVAAGVATLVWPGLTALTLLYLIASWAVVTGIFEVAVAIRLRTAITGEWLLILSGLCSIAFGVLLMLFPGSGALALVVFIGAYAFVTGCLLIVLGVKLRSFAKAQQPIASKDPRTTLSPGMPHTGQQYS